ncbi:hypothetical protein [Brucella anthropi]|uniref:hypothetical protein n=1 Tax=Brucella anthropi TaxID=529 RepID=UPI001F266990|nr:hypothetical protein [Brucella anthropi]
MYPSNEISRHAPNAGRRSVWSSLALSSFLAYRSNMGLGGTDIYSAVCKAVRNGELVEPFRALDLRRVAPGWTYPRYFEFLADHCTDKQSPDVALFVRVAKGRYRLNDQKVG